MPVADANAERIRAFKNKGKGDNEVMTENGNIVQTIKKSLINNILARTRFVSFHLI